MQKSGRDRLGREREQIAPVFIYESRYNYSASFHKSSYRGAYEKRINYIQKDCSKWAIRFLYFSKKGHRIRKVTDWDYAHKEAQEEAEALAYLEAEGNNPNFTQTILSTMPLINIRNLKTKYLFRIEAN